MPATDLEIALEKEVSGTFGRLAADILSEQGYGVSPTSEGCSFRRITTRTC